MIVELKMMRRESLLTHHRLCASDMLVMTNRSIAHAKTPADVGLWSVTMWSQGRWPGLEEGGKGGVKWVRIAKSSPILHPLLSTQANVEQRTNILVTVHRPPVVAVFYGESLCRNMSRQVSKESGTNGWKQRIPLDVRSFCEISVFFSSFVSFSKWPATAQRVDYKLVSLKLPSLSSHLGTKCVYSEWVICFHWHRTQCNPSQTILQEQKSRRGLE